MVLGRNAATLSQSEDVLQASKKTPTIENDWRTTELHKFSRLNGGDHALIGAGVRRSKTAVKRG